MINNVDSQQAYIDYVMTKLPDAKPGEVHTMKKGENLWNLAKKALNNEKASNKEISDYMLLIAKLNNLDTIEKMNSLKISDKIYMPEASTKISLKPVNQVNSAATKSEKIPTSAEKSILMLKEAIINDKTVFVEMAYPRSMNLYHVYNDYTDNTTGYHCRKHPLMSFKLDKNGEVKKISFNDQNEKISKFKYDYDMDDKGNIIIDNYVRQTKAGKFDKIQVAELHKMLKNMSKTAELSY